MNDFESYSNPTIKEELLKEGIIPKRRICVCQNCGELCNIIHDIELSSCCCGQIEWREIED